MSNLPIQTLDTAADDVTKPLTTLREVLGFIPNVAGVMANSAPLLWSFFSAFGHFRGDGSFSPAERQVLLLSNAVANSCAWAVAFHSYEAVQDGVSAGDVEALRRRDLPADPRLAALSSLTRALIDQRGHLDPVEAGAFVAAGFTGEQILEVIAGVAVSTMTNYTGNVARPPLEPVIQPYAWGPDAPAEG